MNLEDYITIERVARILATMRMRRTVQGGDAEFYRRYLVLEGGSENSSAACGYLPPRRQWARPRKVARKRRSSSQLQVASILRTVRARIAGGSLQSEPWGRRLAEFTCELRMRVRDVRFTFHTPRRLEVPKLTLDGRRETRTVAVFDDLSDRVLLSCAAGALCAWLEPLLRESDCCYSFRKDGAISHQRAVADLCRWRRAHEGRDLYVAECDIRKFFDSISHEVVRESMAHAARRLAGLDPRLRTLVQGYLACYRTSGGGARSAVGIPQGGALSTVLANLVMARVDSAVVPFASDRLFYARYCDDMVIAATDRELCGKAMSAYLAQLERLSLPPHAPRAFTCLSDYFEAKTKGPFRWSGSAGDPSEAAAWVSFLGNQIRDDGAVRVRKDSAAKHAIRLGQDVGRLVRLVERGTPLREGVTQQDFYRAFEGRLTAKGVGLAHSGDVPKDGICWAAAFPSVFASFNASCGRQMRRLDNRRECLLARVRRVLGLKRRGRQARYMGRPYSYYGYLLKIRRPDTAGTRAAGISYGEL